MFKALALAATLATASAAPSNTLDAPGFYADFNGNSGGFKLYLKQTNSTGTKKSNDFINMQYQRVEECDADGNPINGNGGNNWSLTGGSALTLAAGTRTIDNAVSYYVDATGSKAFGSTTYNLAIHNDLFQNTTTVNMSGIAVPVTTNVLKISMSMSSWPFSDPSHKLCLRFKLNQSGGNNDAKQRKKGKNVDLEIAPGDMPGRSALISLEAYAYPDGSSTSSPVTVTTSGQIYTLVLPYFTSTLFYDPTVSSVSTSGAMTATASAAAAILLGAAAVLRTRGEEEEAEAAE